MPTPVHYADRHPPLPPDRLRQWEDFGRAWGPFFPGYVGIVLEEVRQDYARMRLPHRSQLHQAQGIFHGGALATLVDTVVVPAIASAHDERRALVTLDMAIQYLEPVAGEDVIAEGWVEKRGRSICFCRVEVRTASDVLAVTASVVYKVSSRTIAMPR